jgi:segregation and condensation protein B
MQDAGSGLKLLHLEDSYQLCSKEKYVEVIRTVMDLKRKVPLSSAALEVLSVVAYNQPVTKAYIEQVRGVDCSGVVSSLIEKGLLEEKGRLELPGRPLIYGTTEQFLRCFSLSSIKDLPTPPDDAKTGDIGSQMALEDLETPEEVPSVE